MNGLARALEYHANGLAVFALPYGTKEDGRRWGTYRYVPPNPREVAQMFSGQQPQNIAVITGAASGNLLALDADTPVVYTETSTRLAGLGVETWAVRRELNGTPHDGGGTFVVRTATAVQSTKLDGLDVLAEGRYFIAPPSAHPGGGLYYDATPPPIFTLGDLAALDWLDLQPATPPRPHRRIPRLAWRILSGDAETLARYDSRSESEAALCASLARAGFAFSDVLGLLRTYPGPGKFAELDASNPRNAMRYLGLTWHSAEVWIAEHDNAAGLLARRLRAWALSRPWRGRGASSDRIVFIVHCSIVERCGKDPHGASARELAEMAGVSWRTAAKANRRLANAGLLELVRQSTPSCPHIWRLLAPADLGDSVEPCISSHSINTTVMECELMHTSHDAFRWRGLNKSGAEVLAVLQSVPEANVNELATATGRHRTTVKRKLLQMLNLGLVEPMGDNYWRAVDAPDLDRAARELGTVGLARRQRVKHVQDRRYNRRALRDGGRKD